MKKAIRVKMRKLNKNSTLPVTADLYEKFMNLVSWHFNMHPMFMVEMSIEEIRLLFVQELQFLIESPHSIFLYTYLLNKWYS